MRAKDVLGAARPVSIAESEPAVPLAAESIGPARAFSSLRIPSFRWWFGAQILSGSGGMAQMVGQAWLVLHVLHGGGLALGALSAATFAPVLLGGAWAGSWLQTHDVRHALIGTQIGSAAVFASTGILVATGVVQLWMVFVLALAGGCVMAVDQPGRQLYVVNLVGRERIASAVGLYEVILNASRLIGPAFGGVVLAVFGVAACFFFNAASFLPPLLVLLHFRVRREIDGAERQPSRTGQALRAGLAYVRRTPSVAACILIAAPAGMIFNIGIALPVLATQTFGLGKVGLGALTACFGAGAIPGGFAAAHAKVHELGRKTRVLTLGAGLAVVALAAAPTAVAAFPLMAGVGFLSIWMIASANTLVQVRTTATLRGPVMGLWTMVLPGLGPVTALVSGAITEFVGPRAGYGVAGALLTAVALTCWRALGADR
jgi:MFS family permease